MSDRATAINFYNAAVNACKDSSNPDHLKLAYTMFASACMADPLWPDAFYQSGNNNSDMGLYHASVACWRRALECVVDPSLKAKIKANLSWRLYSLGKVDEALACSEEAIALDPNLSPAWVTKSCLLGLFDRDAEAVEAARMAYALDPKDPLNEMQVAFALLFNREFEEGFKRFESRFAYRLKSYLQFPYPKWEGEPDKTVYLSADQGLGDTLSFSRFIPELCKRAKYVHAAIQPELLRLFNNAFVHIPNLNLLPQPSPFPSADAWTTFVSLPSALGLTNDQIRMAPNISVPNFMIPKNWKVPGRKLHIGISWRGSPLNDIDRHRSIPLEHFLELYRIPGVQLYSLQVGANGEELNSTGSAPIIRGLTQYITDVSDTMALLQHLDMVITCESALGHIASMVNKECWLPYSFLGRDYRVGNTGVDRLWTPNHRIFRQSKDCKWEPVFEQIAEALREKTNVLDRAA